MFVEGPLLWSFFNHKLKVFYRQVDIFLQNIIGLVKKSCDKIGLKLEEE